MGRLLVLGMVLLTAGYSAHAELYRWVDENGKVHFSDRVDEHTSQKAHRIDTDNRVQTTVPVDAGEVPIVRPFDVLARKVFIGDIAYGWKLTTMDRSRVRVGSYHVDSTCVNRGDIILPDAYIEHGDFFPEEDSLSNDVRSFIRGLDYDADTARANELIPKLRNSGALGLRAQITTIDLKACAKYRSNSDMKKPANQLSASSYRASSAEIEVNWSLIDGSGNEIYALTTQGFSGGWQDNSPRTAISKAMAGAAKQLMADKQFVSRLLVEQKKSIQSNNSFSERNIPPNFNGDLYHAVGFSIEGKSWATQYGQNRNVGELSFSGECNARSSLDWINASTHYAEFLPDEQPLTRDITAMLRDAGYPVKNLQSLPWPQKNAETSYLLRAVILDNMVTACAPKRDANAAFLRPGQVPRSEFSRFLNAVIISWELIDRDSGEVLFTLKTNSDGGDLILTRKYHDVALDAWRNATAELFSSSEFVDKIRISSLPQQENVVFPSITTQPMPKLRPKDLVFPGLLLVQEDYDLLRELDSNHVVGATYAEKSCDLAKSLTVGELWGLSGRDISMQAHSFLHQLDYIPRMSTATGYQKQQRDQGYYALRPTVSQIRIDICQPFMDRQSLLSGQSHTKRRHRVFLELDWVLTSADDQSIIYSKKSQGVAGDWRGDSKLDEVLSEALRETIKDILNDPVFLAALDNKKDEDPGFFDKLFGDMSDLDELLSPSAYFARSSLLFTLFSIKNRSVEYFVTHGKWPVSLDQIGFDEHSSEAFSYIRAVAMDGAGEIRLDLGGDTFDMEHFVLTRWDKVSNDYAFECLTNHRALTGDQCKAF